jgi:type II secretory pathway component PulF
MLDAGLPLAQAVRSISEQTENKALQEAMLVVLRDLENGYKLSEAVEKHPKVFNHVFV